MKRKLVKQGAATMMISLPSKWIKANKLGKGDEIDLEEKGDKLEIGSLIKEKSEVSINISEVNKKNIKNILTHLYRRGFDIIKINNLSQEILKEIREITNDLLLGFELTQRTQKSCIIENISEPTKQKYDLILSKIFQIIKETEQIILEDFKNNSFKNKEEIEDLKKQGDRFVLFCRRLLAKGNTGKNTMLHWELLTFLMHIEHRFFSLYTYASTNKLEKNKEILSLLESLINYFKLYSDSYELRKIESIYKINELKQDFYFGKCIRLLEKSKGKNTVILSYIRELFRIIQIGTSPILVELLEKD